MVHDQARGAGDIREERGQATPHTASFTLMDGRQPEKDTLSSWARLGPRHNESAGQRRSGTTRNHRGSDEDVSLARVRWSLAARQQLADALARYVGQLELKRLMLERRPRTDYWVKSLQTKGVSGVCVR